MDGEFPGSTRHEEPRKKKCPLVRLNFDEIMAEFSSSAIRPKTLPAAERKEKPKLQRIVFNPSDFEDSPPKHSKLKPPKRSLANRAKSSGAVSSRRTTTIKHWNFDKDKPKLVTEELSQAKSVKKLLKSVKTKNTAAAKVVKNQENKVSVKKHSSQKEKLKSWFHLPMESKKLDFSTNTPDAGWTVADVNPKSKAALSPTSDLSPTECEFLEIEKSLKMKDTTTPSSTDAPGWAVEVQKIMEQDRSELFKFQNKVEKLVDEFIGAQDVRNEKIMKLLKKAKIKVSATPLKDITAKSNRKSALVSKSGEKVLWKSKTVPEDKVMDKAINLYNSMRNISKSILATPKLNRSSLQTPESVKKTEGASISKIIQRQCLMLHETPYKH